MTKVVRTKSSHEPTLVFGQFHTLYLELPVWTYFSIKIAYRKNEVLPKRHYYYLQVKICLKDE